MGGLVPCSQHRRLPKKPAESYADRLATRKEFVRQARAPKPGRMLSVSNDGGGAAGGDAARLEEQFPFGRSSDASSQEALLQEVCGCNQT